MEDKTAIRHGQPKMSPADIQNVIDTMTEASEWEVGWSTPKYPLGAVWFFTVKKVVAAVMGPGAAPQKVFGVSRLLDQDADATPQLYPFPYPVAGVEIHFITARTATNADPISAYMLKQTYGPLASTGQAFSAFSCRTHGQYIAPTGIREEERNIASLEPSRHDCLERIRREIPNRNDATRVGDNVYQGPPNRSGGIDHFDGSLINMLLRTYDAWLTRAQCRGDWMNEESLREGDMILAGLAIFRVRYGGGNVHKLLQEIDDPKGITGRLPAVIHECMKPAAPNGNAK